MKEREGKITIILEDYKFDWTDEEINQFLKLYRDGVKPSRIARIMKEPVENILLLGLHFQLKGSLIGEKVLYVVTKEFDELQTCNYGNTMIFKQINFLIHDGLAGQFLVDRYGLKYQTSGSAKEVALYLRKDGQND